MNADDAEEKNEEGGMVTRRERTVESRKNSEETEIENGGRI